MPPMPSPAIEAGDVHAEIVEDQDDGDREQIANVTSTRTMIPIAEPTAPLLEVARPRGAP